MERGEGVKETGGGGVRMELRDGRGVSEIGRHREMKRGGGVGEGRGIQGGRGRREEKEGKTEEERNQIFSVQPFGKIERFYS